MQTHTTVYQRIPKIPYTNTITNKTTPFPSPALSQDSVSFSGVRQAGQKQKETVQALGKDLKQKSIKEISTIKNKVKHNYLSFHNF